MCNRWTLWWWPGVHTLLMDVARGGAVEGVAVYAPSGRLHRLLGFSRQQGIVVRFFRDAAPLARRPAREGLRAEAGALLASMQAAAAVALAAAKTEAAAAAAAAAEAKIAGGGEAAAGAESAGVAAAAGPEASNGGAQEAACAGRQLDEVAVSRAAAELAAACVGLAQGSVGECGCLAGAPDCM
jgi:hypothetical protein